MDNDAVRHQERTARALMRMQPPFITALREYVGWVIRGDHSIEKDI